MKARQGEKGTLTGLVLRLIMKKRAWSQASLAEKAGIAPSVVSSHLSRKRAVRDEHLNRYLAALVAPDERRRLLAAWMSDTLEAEVVEDLFARPKGSTAPLHPEVVQWDPGLDQEQQAMLRWWSAELPRDRELDELFRSITRRVGFTSRDEQRPA